MASPSEFVLSLGVEFDVQERDVQNLTKDIEDRIRRSGGIKIVNADTISEAKKAMKDLWDAIAVEADKYLKAVETGNTAVMRQAQTDIRALQKEMDRLYQSSENRGFKSSLTTYVKSVKSGYDEVIVKHQQLDKQIERSATQQTKLERQKQKEEEAALKASINVINQQLANRRKAAEEEERISKQQAQISSAFSQAEIERIRRATQEREKYITSADKESEKISRLIYFLEKNAQAVDKVEQEYKKGNITYEQATEKLDRLRTTHESLIARVSSSENRVDRLNKKFKESITSSDETRNSYDKLENQLQQLDSKASETAKTFDRLDDQIKGGWFNDFKAGFKSGLGEIGGMAVGARLASESIDLIVQGIKNVVSEVKELNKAMTDVQMVAGTTASETMDMFKDYNSLAKDLSVTTKDVAAGAGEFLRQGKSQAETMDLIKASTVQATLAQMDYSTSSELLTSTLNGYKMEVEDVMHVVDALVQVDFKAATSVQELATALQKTANTARISGVDFERLVGYLGAVSSATRQAPELIGRSFKTMFARMQSVAAGAKTDEEGNSINDVEEVLNKLGIRLRETNDTFRDMSDVLDDIAAKWDTLSDAQRNQISNSIAGKNQMEIFIALMENYDQALALEEEALNSNGAAMERYSIYQESIAAKQAELTAEFEKFAYSESTADLIKSFLELGKSLVYVAEALKPVIDLLSTTITIVSKLTGGIFEFVGAVLNLDADYFKKLFGKDTETNIENTEQKIADIKEQIELLNESDIDFDVKQEELQILKDNLKEANDELERLRGEKRNEGYSSNIQYSWYNTTGGNEILVDQEVNLKNINDLYEQEKQKVIELSDRKETLNKKNKEEYTLNERNLVVAKKNVKAYEDWIVEVYSQIRATQELFDEHGRLSDSLTEEERNIVLLVHSNADLLTAYHETSAYAEEAKNAIRDVAGAEADAKDKTDTLVDSIVSLNDTVNELDLEMSAVNAALEQYQNEGKLSAKTALDLVNANSKYAAALEITADGITLNVSKLQELSNQSILTARANILAARQTAAAWEAAQKSKDKLTGKPTGIEGTSHWAEENITTDYTTSWKPEFDSSYYDALLAGLMDYNYGSGTSNYRPPSSSGSDKDKDKDKDTSDRDAEEALRNYQNMLKEKENMFKAYLDNIIKIFDKEKDALEKEKDKWEEYYSAKIDAIKEQEELEDQELERQEKLLEIERLRADLAKASQTMVRRYRRGVGFVYETDTEAVAAAQDKLTTALKSYEEWQKKIDRDKEIKDIEDAKDKVIKDLDDQIDKLDELADKWKESLDITEDTTKYKDLLDDMAKFEKANLDERLKYLDDFTKAYMDLVNKINAANQVGNAGSSWGSIGGGSGNITQIGGSGGGSGATSTGKPGESTYTNSMGQTVKHTEGSGPGIIFDSPLGIIYNADGTNTADKYGETIWEYLGIEEPKGNYDLHGGIQSWFLDNWGFNPLEGSSPNNILVNGVPLNQHLASGKLIGPNDKGKPSTGGSSSSGSGSSGSSSNRNPNMGGGKDSYQDYLDDKYGGITSDDDYYKYTGNKPSTSGGKDYSKPSGSGSSDSSAYWSSEKDKNKGSSSTSGGRNPSTRPGTVEDTWYSARGRKNVFEDHMSIVGEEGPELRVLHQGDGIVPADATENLMEWGNFSPTEFISRIGEMTFMTPESGSDIYNMNFESLVLPDVTDFESFKEALISNSRNYAVQIQSNRK